MKWKGEVWVFERLDTKSFFCTWRDFVPKVIWLFPTRAISNFHFAIFTFHKSTKKQTTSSSKKNGPKNMLAKWPYSFLSDLRPEVTSQGRLQGPDGCGHPLMVKTGFLWWMIWGVFIVSGITWMVGFWTEDFQGQGSRRYQGPQDNLWEGKVTSP